MTLDLAKFISNSIKTQAKIQHLDVFTKTADQKSIPESVASLISKQYGEKYLLDSDFVAFFWGHLDKKQIEKLFNVVDKALGKSANKLTETDFKKLKLNDDESSSIEDEQADENSIEEPDSNDVDDSSSEEEPEEIDSNDEDVDDESSDDSEYTDSDEESDDSEDDDSEEELDEDENEDVASLPTSHFFLKITLK